MEQSTVITQNLTPASVFGMPAVAVRGKVVFPNVYTTIEVGRVKSLAAVNASIKGDRLIFLVCQKDVKVDSPTASDLYEVGTVCKVGNLAKVGNENFRLTVEGLYRAKVTAVDEGGDYFSINVEKLEGDLSVDVETEAYFRASKELFKETSSVLQKFNKDTSAKIYAMEDVEEFINTATFNLPIKEKDKQRVLEAVDLKERLILFHDLISFEKEIIKVNKSIADRVKNSVENNQKEFYLREQLKAIHSELGDDMQEIDMLTEKIKAKNMPKESEEKVLQELTKMTKMQPSSPDYTVLRSYIDWIIDLPFSEESVDTEELSRCQEILEEDHFGLDKVKERITEYLAVLKLTKALKGPILCLVGPPGVGKTSVAKSVARALNRKLVRMSLGGVKDEAEIRGHRRTYIGAMPGRILYGMKQAGSVNPVFLLDEIDKISADIHGDPASAFLEVLDPEQNSSFRDRFLEYPYDLSKVLFNTTANSLETIPSPLRDRMEIIELSSYTREEKLEIARRYLVPKQLTANGLNDNNATFTLDGLQSTIEGYTKEAGVRTLERTIGTLCRKIAVQYANDKNLPQVNVNADMVSSFLGSPRFLKEDDRVEKAVGTVTGLAWTAVGGTTLTIEALLMPGKGELKLTGKLGDVMKESALAALSYIRAHAQEYNIPNEKFTIYDLHVHVPDGATPKDGPSAGITMATAILSAYSGLPVRGDVAMTGEISLRGKVLPIGGLKEKSLAARRVGIKTVIIPDGNQKDLEELPKLVKEELTFLPVKNVEEVFSFMLDKQNANLDLPQKKKAKRPPKATPLPVVPDENTQEGVRCEKA